MTDIATPPDLWTVLELARVIALVILSSILIPGRPRPAGAAMPACLALAMLVLAAGF